MQNNWVKLYRKILDNEVFRHDWTAWHVFETLLVIADKNSGKWSGGLFQLSELTEINKNTLYKAVKRLEKHNMIKRSVNGRFTVYYICNWKEYQATQQTASKQRVNSQENSNKNKIENIDNELSIGQSQYGKPEINQLFETWESEVGYPISSRVKANRNACNNLLKKNGVEGVERLIRGVALAGQDEYAPTIGDFTELQSKLNKLLAWGKKKSVINEVIEI